MKNVNWDNVQDEVRRPTAGGYAVRIIRVEDVKAKEYLRIEWDFAEGAFKGCNQKTYDAFGFWPTAKMQSYKEKALRFFKGFKTSVEMSNPNYVFRNDPKSLEGKFVGVVLGEEEYLSNDGKVKTRLYVDSWRSGKAIRDGDFTVPPLKKLTGSDAPAAAPAGSNYGLLEDDDENLPF